MRHLREARGGFTLIELLAVLVIAGLLAAVAMFRLSGTTQAAQFEWAVQRLAATDGLMRTHATNSGQPGALRFELGSGRVRRSFGERRNVESTTELGRSVRIARFASPNKDAETGDERVDYSPQGTCPTYAVEIVGPGDRSTWLLFAGITGEAIRLENSSEVTRLMRALRSSGSDPD